jgi:hypothetical protein
MLLEATHPKQPHDPKEGIMNLALLNAVLPAHLQLSEEPATEEQKLAISAAYRKHLAREREIIDLAADILDVRNTGLGPDVIFDGTTWSLVFTPVEDPYDYRCGIDISDADTSQYVVWSADELQALG